MDIWVVSSLKAVISILEHAFWCRMYAFVLGTHLAVEFLGHTGSAFVQLKETLPRGSFYFSALRVVYERPS